MGCRRCARAAAWRTRRSLSGWARTMTEMPFEGVRVRYDSAKSYDELLAALLADIGEKPVPINDISTGTDDWEAFRERVESHVGPSGFMLFGVFNHGAWLTKTGIDRKAIRVVLG